MAIIGFDPDEIIDYVPEFAGNRQSDEPCVVRLKFVSHSKINRYAMLITARCKGVTSEKEREQVVLSVQRQQFVENVESIKGYYVKGEERTDPEQVYKHLDKRLVAEIIQAMEDSQRLMEGQVKN